MNLKKVERPVHNKCKRLLEKLILEEISDMGYETHTRNCERKVVEVELSGLEII